MKLFFCVAFIFLGLAMLAKESASEDSDCIPVSKWYDFKTAVKREENLVICSFNIVKPEAAQIALTKSARISCSQPNECTIVGKGHHISVRSTASEFILSGFVFVGASENALRFDRTSSSNRHEINNCVFRGNHGPLSKEGGRGGALRISSGVNITISNTRFVDNRAFFGGAVSVFGGKVSFSNCTFSENLGFLGSSIAIASSDASVTISSTSFESNAATRSNSGAIHTIKPDALRMLAGTKGVNNDGCNGAYDDSSKTCIPFPDTLVPPQLSIGDLTKISDGIRFSNGLVARVVARSGEPVVYTSPEAKTLMSSIPFHLSPDGAAAFSLDRGGYIYISNSEEPSGKGGVYGLEFDERGYTRDYKPVLQNTSRNCNGGKTPWDTWISCEEVPQGQCWQVDPQGKRTPPAKTEMGGTGGGEFEAFAYDNSDPSAPAFFVTEDKANGALRRFRPTPGSASDWRMLHDTNGTLDYLQFLPGNKFRWTSSLMEGRDSAQQYYPNTEGVAYHNRMLMFVSKVQKELFRLDVDEMTYSVESTQTGSLQGGGSFGSGPDHLLATSGGVLYFTEDGGSSPGVFVYDGSEYKAFLEADTAQYVDDEVTGIAFSPDTTKLFFCLQQAGVCFQVSRVDGLPLANNHRILEWKYSLGRDSP